MQRLLRNADILVAGKSIIVLSGSIVNVKFCFRVIHLFANIIRIIVGDTW